MKLLRVLLLAFAALLVAAQAGPQHKTKLTPKEKRQKLFDQVRSSKQDDLCVPLKTQDECDASPSCTWCFAGAVPSACYSVEDAKKLPAAVFKCDQKKLRTLSRSRVIPEGLQTKPGREADSGERSDP